MNQIPDVFERPSLLSMRRTRAWLFLVLFISIVFSALHLSSIAGVELGFVPLTAFLIFAAALICEFMDSCLGMGYGTTLTPILLLAGFSPLDIVPAILLSELLTGVAATLMHQRDGNVDFLGNAQARHTALLLGSLSSVGAVLAVWVAISISKFWLGVCITVIIVAMGGIILATRNRQIPFRGEAIVVVGAVAAFNKGLSGGGYGPLVTAGQIVSGLPAKLAIGVTSMAEALTCLIALLAYGVMGKVINWSLAIPLVMGAMLSVPMATLTVSRASEARLRGIVGVVTLLLGIVALAKLL